MDAHLKDGKKSFTKRAEGRVWDDFVSLAKVTVASADSYEVLWNLELLAKLRLPRAQIEKELKETGNSDAGVQWG